MYRSDNVAFAHADVRASGNNAIPHKYAYNTSTATYQPYTEYWWDSDSYHSLGVSSNQFYIDGSVVWNAGNDGAGSGLDADLLDGNQASAFYLASNPNGYTSNTGTVTSITVSAGTGLSGGGTVTTSGTVTLNLSTPVTVANGGTGATSFTAGYVLFGNGTSAINTSANLFWDNSNARLGISTTGPSEKLHVEGGNIYINGEGTGLIVDAGGSKRIGFMKYGGHEAYIARVASQDFGIVRVGGSTITDGSSITTDIWVKGDGNVAIGGQTAAYKLYVSGDIYATSNITAYSDVRAKENIVTVDNAIEKIKNIRGVYYTRKEDETKKRNIGVIAQEMLKVVPEVVSYAEEIDTYSVAYGNIVGLLIEAIKELNKKIETLEGEKTK